MSIRLKISTDTGDEAQPLPRVVLLGDVRTPEFASVEDHLNSAVPAKNVIRIRGLAELGKRHRQGETADLVVIVQTWSDEFPFREFMKLPGIGPYIRVICCHGPWCISDGRSRQDWPLSLRVPLEHFRTALIREWRQLTNPSREDGDPIPWTAGRDEIFRARQRPIQMPPAAGAPKTGVGNTARNVDADAGSILYVAPVTDSPVPITRRGTPVRVVSTDSMLAETWVELLRQTGMMQAGESSAGGEIVFWDVDPWAEEIGTLWTERLTRFPGTRIVALTGFAGPDRVRELRNLGAVAVISKHLPLEDLAFEIEQML